MDKTDFYFTTLGAIANQCQTTLETVEAVLYNFPTEATDTEAIKAALTENGLLLFLSAA